MARSNRRNALRAALVVVAAAAVGTACGQITRLSDDYSFDADGATAQNEGGSSSGSDGSTSEDGRADGDAARDVATDTTKDSGQTCDTVATTSASTVMSSMNGTEVCKKCLATRCCSAVTNCGTGGSNCRSGLSCHLDCTTKGNPSQCMTACTTKGDNLSVGLAACARDGCDAECGF